MKPGLVVLVGAPASGKSTTAATFDPAAVISSDAIREELLGDAGDQSANERVFAVMRSRVEARLGQGLLTVVDSTNVMTEQRQVWVRLARTRGTRVTAIVHVVPVQALLARNADRGRQVPEDVIRVMAAQLGEGFEGEGYDEIRQAGSL